MQTRINDKSHWLDKTGGKYVNNNRAVLYRKHILRCRNRYTLHVDAY